MDLGSNTDLLPVMLYARRAGEWDYSNCLTLLLRHKASGGAGLAGGLAWSCACVGLAGKRATAPVLATLPALSPRPAGQKHSLHKHYLLPLPTHYLCRLLPSL